MLAPADGALAAALSDLAPGHLVQLVLDALVIVPPAPLPAPEPARLLPGQTLQLQLDVTLAGPPPTPIEPLFLTVDIVEDPVTPAPQAAYALLARRHRDEAALVECPRFAWGPQPARMELICAADLHGEVVRRRAVFRWTDASRSAEPVDYAVQKFAPGGATHVPEDFVSVSA